MAIYFSILYLRYHAGFVTDEMMAIPKFRFIVIGILEALGVVTGMASAGISTLFQFSLRLYHSIFTMLLKFICSVVYILSLEIYLIKLIAY